MSRKFKTIKVRLPKELLRAMKRKIDGEFYASASEYVSALIRKDLHGQAAGQLSDSPEGIHSANGKPADGASWQKLHEMAHVKDHPAD
jgi:Arc/MetJ-type ribon-helix-helix transcriptional regulator